MDIFSIICHLHVTGTGGESLTKSEEFRKSWILSFPQACFLHFWLSFHPWTTPNSFLSLDHADVSNALLQESHFLLSFRSKLRCHIIWEFFLTHPSQASFWLSAHMSLPTLDSTYWERVCVHCLCAPVRMLGVLSYSLWYLQHLKQHLAHGGNSASTGWQVASDPILQ